MSNFSCSEPLKFTLVSVSGAVRAGHLVFRFLERMCIDEKARGHCTQ